MRPTLLNPLFANAAAIKGIGPKIEKVLEGFLRPSIDGKRLPLRVVDLLFHLPSGFIDRRQRPTVANLPSDGHRDRRGHRRRAPPAAAGHEAPPLPCRDLR